MIICFLECFAASINKARAAATPFIFKPFSLFFFPFPVCFDKSVRAVGAAKGDTANGMKVCQDGIFDASLQGYMAGRGI